MELKSCQIQYTVYIANTGLCAALHCLIVCVRPSSAASEFSQFSVKSSGSRTASANREVGTKKSLESSTHKKVHRCVATYLSF